MGTILKVGGEIGATALEIILGRLGRGLGEVIRGASSLLSDLMETNLGHFDGLSYDESGTHDPYIIMCKTRDEAQMIADTINNYCSPHIENWWVDTQDELVKGGARVREELVIKIKEDIQQISNELSK